MVTVAETPPDDDGPRGNNGLPADFKWGDMPPELANMNTEASGVNEIYLAQMAGGFTASQALYLTAALITGNPGIAPDGPPQPA